MNLFTTSSASRWLIVPATPLAFLAKPALGGQMLIALSVLFAAGFFEQAVRLERLPSSARWIGRGIAVLAGLFVLRTKIQWVTAELSYVEVAVILLAGACGLLLGLFVASLGHQGFELNESTSAERLGTRKSTRRGRAELVKEANRLAVTESPEAPPHETPIDKTVEPKDVEVHVDGAWLPGLLHSWDTRNLRLYGEVTFTVGGNQTTQWVPAECLRAMPAGSMAADPHSD